MEDLLYQNIKWFEVSGSTSAEISRNNRKLLTTNRSLKLLKLHNILDFVFLGKFYNVLAWTLNPTNLKITWVQYWVAYSRCVLHLCEWYWLGKFCGPLSNWNQNHWLKQFSLFHSIYKLLTSKSIFSSSAGSLDFPWYSLGKFCDLLSNWIQSQ